MHKSLFALPLCLILAACGTPQQQCIAAATRNLSTVDGLIRESEANLARGYGYQDVLRTIPKYVDCTPNPTEDNPEPKPQMCWVDSVQTFQQPVAIDLAAEQTKLTQLRAKRAELAAEAEAAVTQCQAQYPEEG